MENKIQIFNSTEFGSVRTLETTDGKVLFCGADVAKALGYSNAPDALSRHCRCIVKHDIPHPQSPNKEIEMTFITEGDMYRLITHSKLPNAERFESWVFDEVLPTIHRTGSYQICEDNSENSLAERKLALEEMQVRLRMSEHLFSLANVETISENYRTILIAKSAEMLTGEQILMLPKTEQKTYSAGEVGSMFGVSAQKIGRLANEYNLKTSEYGEWFRDKSPYSCKEIDTFRYNDKAVEFFRNLLE